MEQESYELTERVKETKATKYSANEYCCEDGKKEKERKDKKTAKNAYKAPERFAKHLNKALQNVLKHDRPQPSETQSENGLKKATTENNPDEKVVAIKSQSEGNTTRRRISRKVDRIPIEDLTLEQTNDSVPNWLAENPPLRDQRDDPRPPPILKADSPPPRARVLKNRRRRKRPATLALRLANYFGIELPSWSAKKKTLRNGKNPVLNWFTDNLTFLQRTGPSDLYSKPPRNPLIENRPFQDELDDFTDDETSPLTEPIYGGR